jgi:hypothetical protein
MRTAKQPSKRWQEQGKHESARMPDADRPTSWSSVHSAVRYSSNRLIGSLFSVHASGRELKLSRPASRFQCARRSRTAAHTASSGSATACIYIGPQVKNAMHPIFIPIHRAAGGLRCSQQAHQLTVPRTTTEQLR